MARGEKIKIIVGAAETYERGWYSTNEQWLDITKRSDWDNVCRAKRLITHVVAEHVFEHLTYDEFMQALAHMSAYMVDGARIASRVRDQVPSTRSADSAGGSTRTTMVSS